MKKILLLLITLFTLVGCGTTTSQNEIVVNDPLEYSVKIKDNAEFILIHEGISIEEATQIILDNLEIETNADDYDWYWVGEAAVDLSIDEIENFEEYIEKETYVYYEDLTLESIQKATLDHDSLRPIKLIFSFKKNNEETKTEKEIVLCVAREDEYNAISNSESKTVEELYQAINLNGSSMKFVDNYIDGYVSNIRKYTD